MGGCRENSGCSYKAAWLLTSSTRLYIVTLTTTMLTLIQLIILFFWTSVSSSDAEKLFHNRDHSDVQNVNSHRAEVITDKYSAEVNNFTIFRYSITD